MAIEWERIPTPALKAARKIFAKIPMILVLIMILSLDTSFAIKFLHWISMIS
jgi:hypothetical protein